MSFDEHEIGIFLIRDGLYIVTYVKLIEHNF